VPILHLPAVLGRRDDPALRVATTAGATSVVLPLTGFLRWVFVVPPLARSYVTGDWVFVVPPLARSYVTGDAAARATADAAWTAQHQCGGALLGEHLGQLLAIGWSVTLCVIIVRARVLPRWLGVTGLAVSALYLLNQGDILATAVPGLPVWGPWPARSAEPGRGNLDGRPRASPSCCAPAPATLQGPAPATRPATAGPRGAEHRISTRPPPRPHAAHTGPLLTDSRERPIDRSTP
jgi:hypothetical protein